MQGYVIHKLEIYGTSHASDFIISALADNSIQVIDKAHLTHRTGMAAQQNARTYQHHITPKLDAVILFTGGTILIGQSKREHKNQVQLMHLTHSHQTLHHTYYQSKIIKDQMNLNQNFTTH